MMTASLMHEKHNACLWAAIGIMCMMVLSLAGSWAQAEQDMSAELEVSRRLQSVGLVPVVGEYVSYDVMIKNTGGSTIEHQLLWVHFVSDNGKTDSKATFSIPQLAPDASAELRIGPFKMLASGNHCLYLGANRDGDMEAPNQVTLNYLPDKCADSITSYAPVVATWLPAGAGLVLAGVALLGWYLVRRA